MQNSLTNYTRLLPNGVSARSSEGEIEDASWWEIVTGALYSDQRMKNNISDLGEDLDIFYDNLKPKVFNYIEKAKRGNTETLHIGFIAQDINDTLNDMGLDKTAFTKMNEGYWNIFMNEFIALNTWQIQRLKSKFKELECQLAQLNNK